jgi:UDP-N-acetylmuramyl pentapeptide phosphotransferase/UDP-N-acetylglucosamine-1-phosphate transferase
MSGSITLHAPESMNLIIGTPAGILATAFVTAALVAFLLIRFEHLHARLTGDTTVGPQKFHAHQVSRVGGLAVIVGIAFTLLCHRGSFAQADVMRDGILLMLCAVPAMAAGFAEDVLKDVRVSVRLGATCISAWLAYFMLGGVLDRVDVAGLDTVLAIPLAGFLFTAFAVAGIANAINIIDGYNGLAGMVSVFVLTATAYVAWQVGDASLATVSLVAAAAMMGFLVWNFPRGRIFLGDGGAYFIGFVIAEVAVLLVRRHPEVSPWFCFMLVAYPVLETMFSIYRKRVLRGLSPGRPDGLHLHMLVYKRVVRWKVGSRDPADRLARNSLTSPYLWALSLATIVPATIFWRSSAILAFLAFGFTFLYIALYRRLVTFRVPRWIRLRSPGRRTPDPETRPLRSTT